MKKIALVLALLLVLGTAGVFAEVTVGGEFQFGVLDLGTTSSSTEIEKAEININASVDDYTSVAAELDAEGGDWTNKNIALDDFRLTSDITGALGLDVPVSVSMTAGLFDTYFTNWNYVSRSGEEFYYSTQAGSFLWKTSPKTSFAAAFDVTVMDLFTVKYWQPMDGSAVSVAVTSSPVELLNFLIGYYASTSDFAGGKFWLDAGLSLTAGPAAIKIPVAFAYALSGYAADAEDESNGLEDGALAWSSGVAVDYDAYHLAVGVGGQNGAISYVDDSVTNAMFKDLNVEVSTSAVENADLYAIADFDFTTSTTFQSVDLGGSYKFGALKVAAGYVVALDESYGTAIGGDAYTLSGSGLYLIMDVDY